jgi:DNA-binding LytR/AlgR family response regulator
MAPLSKPSLHLPDGHFIPDVSLVSSIRAAANYVEIQVGDGVVLTRATMSDLEERLSAHGFRRIHRSVIVNWAMVESVGPQRKRLSIKLTTGERLAVGPSYRDQVTAH